MEVDNKKNVEEKRNGRVEKGLTEEQGWGVAITGKGLFPMFMATNFHFNAEFPSFPSFFFSSSFSFLPLVSFFFFFFLFFRLILSWWKGRWKKKKRKKRRGIMGPRLNARTDYPVISQDFQKFLSPLSPSIHCFDGKTLLGP